MSRRMVLQGVPLTAIFIILLALTLIGCRNTDPPFPQVEEPPESTPRAISNMATETMAPPRERSAEMLQDSDFSYRGAFRLPGSGERPLTFAYGGNGMTVNPQGDPSGRDDNHPGSLFLSGHERMPYGELPDGNQIAEINIPAPIISANLDDLAVADFIQNFEDVAAGNFFTLDEIPRMDIEYLDTPLTGPKIHIAWGAHFQPDPPVASHAWIDPTLSNPSLQGTWFIGDQNQYAVNDYLFTIPADWADQHTGGHLLATGRYRDGGWSGMGPALFTYQPWDDHGAPFPAGTHLSEIVLLQYESSERSSTMERSLTGYQHPDEWGGAAWITTSSGKSGVLFAGTKGVGDKYWYGFTNPAGPQLPCVAGDFVGQFEVCRMADGSPCPAEDLQECPGHPDNRGWWSSRFEARFMLYHPDDLAAVASGSMMPWEPQPYQTISLDEHLFLNPAGIETEMLGSGDQQQHRIGAITFDRLHGFLYVLELFADEAQPVVHVWEIE
jgi:hypothetical protein